MLLHTFVKHNIYNPNKLVNAIRENKYNGLAINNYEKDYQKDDETNSEFDMETYDDISSSQRQIVRSGYIEEWKPLSQPGVYAISFLRLSSNSFDPIYRYGNAFAFLPVSSSEIYTATNKTGQPNYNITNIYQGTRTGIKTFTSPVNYGTIVGNGIDTGIFDDAGTNIIYAIARDSSGNIYIGGKFVITTGASTAIRCLAKWDGTSWSQVGNFSLINFNSRVYSIVVSGTRIYVGGYFSNIDETFTSININNPAAVAANEAASFAIWNGTTWSATFKMYDSLGEIASVYAMKASGSDIYIGGNMTSVSKGALDISYNYIFRLNTSSLITFPLGNGVSSSVFAMDTDPSSNLYVGGAFTSAYNTSPSSILTVNRIVRWNKATSKWLIFRDSRTVPKPSVVGLNNNVYAIAVNPTKNSFGVWTGNIWVGGIFTNRQPTIPATQYNYSGNNVVSFNWSSKRWTQRDYTNTLGV